MEEMKNLRVGYSRRTGFLHRAPLFSDDIYIYVHIHIYIRYLVRRISELFEESWLSSRSQRSQF